MTSTKAPPLKPRALHPGDTVGIVAPASNIQRADLEVGAEALRRAGYKPFYCDSIFDQDIYFAGSVERRARELEAMFDRDEVKAIVCARGGYGANYLLPVLDLEKIKSHPKIFVGYSDVTTLLTYFHDAAGLTTFHGPMVAKDWAREGGVEMASWQAALADTAPWEVSLGAVSGVAGLVDGSAEGMLYGGCLSMLVASLGTPYEIETSGTILLIEDVAAKPFQIDRMLMQLKLAGKLAPVRGIVFGQMPGCIQAPNQGYTLEHVVTRVVKGLGVPVAYGLPSGHVMEKNITLPIGVPARLTVSGENVRLKILEAAVSSAGGKQ